MKSIWKWVLVFVGVFVLVLIIATPFFLRSNGGWLPMMGGFGFPMHRGFGLMGGLFMLPMLLVPLAILGLAIFGVVALVRKPRDIVVPTEPCAYCTKPLQMEWTTCPYCGKKKKK